MFECAYVQVRLSDEADVTLCCSYIHTTIAQDTGASFRCEGFSTHSAETVGDVETDDIV